MIHPDYVPDEKPAADIDNCTELDDKHFLEGQHPFLRTPRQGWHEAAAALVTRGREAIADYVDSHPRLQRVVWGAAAFARGLG